MTSWVATGVKDTSGNLVIYRQGDSGLTERWDETCFKWVTVDEESS